MTLNLRRCAAAALLTASVFGLTRISRADLLGFWDFNNENAPAPSLALDQSGKGNGGAIAGAEYTADKGGWTGKAGDKGIRFDGGSDTIFLSTATKGAFNSIGTNNKVTVAFWWFGDDTQPINQSQFWAEPNRSFQAHVPWSDSNVYFDTGGCCAVPAQRLSGAITEDQFKGQWNHWVFIKDGDDKYIYVNGTELLSNLGDATTPMVAPVGGIWLGSANGNNSSSGDYDDFAIWDEALSPSDVTKVYEQGVRALEPGLGVTTSVAMEADIDVVGGKLVGRAVGVTTGDFGTKALAGVEYVVSQKISHVLQEPGTTPIQGYLKSTWLNGNLTSDGAWDATLANPAAQIVPPFLLDKISYGGNTPNGYPAQTGITGNRENYSVQWEGEIFIPQGTVSFWDGNDDYTKLVIGGETLIQDNDWTSWDGSQNAGATAGDTGSFTGTKSDATVEGLKGGWYPIIFRGAEGGGGDNFRLVWDVGDIANTGPDAGAAYANPDAAADTYYTVGSPFLRAANPGITVSATVPLGQVNAFGGPVGYAGNNGLGSAGTNVEIPLNGSPAPDIQLTGTVDLVLTASGGGLTQTVEKTLSFGGGGGIPGDIDGNGKVDLTDFGILKANFGKGGGAAVPEPSTLLLAGLGLLGLGLARWGRRRK
jgi:hypothetical protein